MSELLGYEVTVGLEVHVELNTKTKIFCSCPTSFGALPNCCCCPVCMGLPGGLPVLNRRAVELAVLAGVALHAEIAEVCRMDRKQYHYPDLPKGYQISQAEFPICRGGYLEIGAGETLRRIGLTRIHLEEDAGKLIHAGGVTQIDHNRCGVPLIEIVSEPELHSGAEAAAYLRELRGILLACDISDCKMQEGSLRCDVNLSVRRVGQEALGTRTEIKNINSFSFVEKAINYEAHRQIAELEATGAVKRQTMRYESATGRTEPMRSKEQAEDYRFFPEPDLPAFRISHQTVERMRALLPELPAARRSRLSAEYGMTAAEAEILTSIAGLADYYEKAAKDCRHPILLLHLLLNDLLRHCTEEPFSAPLSPEQLSELAELLGEGSITSAVAKKLLVRLLETQESPRSIAEREELMQVRDPEVILSWVKQAMCELSAAVSDYRAGKTNAMRALQGKVMALSRGRADPIMAERLLCAELEKESMR